MTFQVDSWLFRRLTEEEAPGFVLQLSVTGRGFAHRAVPLRARVGDVELQEIFMHFSGEGFSGMLATEPAEGDRLFVGYLDEGETETPVTYGSSGGV